MRSPTNSAFLFSPHTWGWTLFKALRRMSDKSFPHTRGDGPLTEEQIADIHKFSPHTWGWTFWQDRSRERACVFPTHVGMDLTERISGYHAEISFPHTRGDGPLPIVLDDSLTGFSPHTWGWTRVLGASADQCKVFPTHVGMDLHCFRIYSARQSFPHTRGDGPAFALVLEI